MATDREMAEAKTDEELLIALEGYEVDSPPADQVGIELTYRRRAAPEDRGKTTIVT